MLIQLVSLELQIMPLPLLFASQNNTNFYNTSVFSTLGGSGDFFFSFENFSARYARIQSTSDVTATVTVAGK